MQVRETIRASAPQAEETIKYGIPTFTLHGNLVHFGAYKHHIGFYPAPSGIEAFKKKYPYTNTRKVLFNSLSINHYPLHS